MLLRFPCLKSFRRVPERSTAVSRVDSCRSYIGHPNVTAAMFMEITPKTVSNTPVYFASWDHPDLASSRSVRLRDLRSERELARTGWFHENSAASAVYTHTSITHRCHRSTSLCSISHTLTLNKLKNYITIRVDSWVDWGKTRKEMEDIKPPRQNITNN